MSLNKPFPFRCGDCDGWFESRAARKEHWETTECESIAALARRSSIAAARREIAQLRAKRGW